MKFNRKIKNVLITGISGSGGSYLCEYILSLQKRVKVYGISRWHSTSSNSNLYNVINKINLIECDLCDLSSIINALNISKPDAIFHLASSANVKASFETPSSVMNNNIMSTINLLEAVRLLKFNPIIQICSTSEVYGQVSKKDIPIKETNQFNPTSPYAVSKITQDLLGKTYFTAYKLKIITTRMFAYFNPRRTDLFASSFAKQVAWIEVGLQKKLLHGNLDSVRTLIDVRDAMRAYWLAVQYCKFGEVYNIGGLKSIKVGDFLKVLINLSNSKILTQLDPKLMRPVDVTLQIPNTNKFNKITRFKTQYSFEESVEHLLEFWRLEAKKEVMRLKYNKG
jgi:GDPmannose 4,6-dehydratase/GDP-4-dehydro-6-deoxy-D-mannose reductase|tara:strand:+ start:1271 stop:2284 length:1014 start_codon:yes stop_codon:yes gene_type:complete